MNVWKNIHKLFYKNCSSEDYLPKLGDGAHRNMGNCANYRFGGFNYYLTVSVWDVRCSFIHFIYSLRYFRTAIVKFLSWLLIWSFWTFWLSFFNVFFQSRQVVYHSGYQQLVCCNPYNYTSTNILNASFVTACDGNGFTMIWLMLRVWNRVVGAYNFAWHSWTVEGPYSADFKKSFFAAINRAIVDSRLRRRCRHS